METIRTLQIEVEALNDLIEMYKEGLTPDLTKVERENFKNKIDFYEGVKKFKTNKIINLKNQN